MFFKYGRQVNVGALRQTFFYMTRLLTFACCALLLLPSFAAAGAHSHRHAGPPGAVVPGVVIVKFKPEVSVPSGALAKSAGAVANTLFQRGVRTLSRVFPDIRPTAARMSVGIPVDLSRIYYATVDAETDVREAAHRLSGIPGVEYAEPKYRQRVSEAPNDTLFAKRQAGYFARLNAIAGWDVAKGDSAVTIAAVDGGTYWQHEDIQGNLWINAAEDLNKNGRFDPGPPPAGDEDGIDQDGDGKADDVIGWNFANNTNNPRGLVSTPGNRAHGTATVSHFGAVTNNVTGMAGSSWNCRVMPICAGSSTADNVVEFGYEGIEYAFAHGAQIINCSWGRLGPPSLFERDVIVAASQAGSLIVAAAGNDTVNVDLSPEYPGGYPEVAGIGATNSTDDHLAFFSNFGVNALAFAPGTNIWSALDGGGYGNGGSGTSYSSPLVAGLAGILKSVHPSWRPEQIMMQIRTTADSIDAANPSAAGLVGRGRANFGRALTESHAGIRIVASSVLTPAGREYFIPGDTVVVSLTVRNVLPKAAANLQFTTTSADPAFQVLSGPVTVGTLAPDSEAVVLPMEFKIGQVSSNHLATVTVGWVSNGNERDASAFRFFLFTTTPRWLLQPVPVKTALYSVRAVSPTVAWAAGGNDSSTAPAVLRTVDGGRNWKNVTALLSGGTLYAIFAIDELHAWAGSGDGRIFATIDGGLSWSQQLYPGTQSPFIDGIWFFDASNGFALGDPATGSNQFVLLKTTDGGTTWAHLPSEPQRGAGEAGWNNSFWWTDRQHGWFGTNNYRIHGTSDGGASWFTGPTSSQNSVGVSFKDSLNGVAAFDDGFVQVTTDGGVSWVLRNSPPQAASLTSTAFATGTNSVWTSNGILPYHSRDAGRTWVTEAAFPFDGTMDHLSFADSSHGWAVTTFGEILHYLGDTSRVVPPPSGPTIFTLEQNYPNPFGKTTSIAFTVPTASHVTITVYDILGRRVRVAYEGDRPAGTWHVEFSGEGLASGVYIYRMETAEFETTRKMLVVH